LLSSLAETFRGQLLGKVYEAVRFEHAIPGVCQGGTKIIHLGPEPKHHFHLPFAGWEFAQGRER
jgi:hypothetical protein